MKTKVQNSLIDNKNYEKNTYNYDEAIILINNININNNTSDITSYNGIINSNNSSSNSSTSELDNLTSDQSDLNNDDDDINYIDTTCTCKIDEKDQNKDTILNQDQNENKYKIVYSICGKSKNNLLPISTRNYSLDKGNFGDDVGFQCELSSNYYFGLADGVSANRKKGYDAKLFPSALMSTCNKLLETIEEYDYKHNNGTNKYNLFELLCKSHNLVQINKVYGSSTVCLLNINKLNGLLTTLNLGDSGYMIIRNSQVFYKSISQSHRFNCPYQIGCTAPEFEELDLYRDMPEDSICLTHKLEFKDFILLSTDGLFDNLYEDEIALILNNHFKDQIITQQLLDSASKLLVEKAYEANIKKDDILVFIIYICENNHRISDTECNDNVNCNKNEIDIIDKSINYNICNQSSQYEI